MLARPFSSHGRSGCCPLLELSGERHDAPPHIVAERMSSSGLLNRGCDLSSPLECVPGCVHNPPEESARNSAELQRSLYRFYGGSSGDRHYLKLRSRTVRTAVSHHWHPEFIVSERSQF